MSKTTKYTILFGCLDGQDEYLGFMIKENWEHQQKLCPDEEVKFVMEFEGPDLRPQISGDGLNDVPDGFEDLIIMSETTFAVLPRKKIPC